MHDGNCPRCCCGGGNGGGNGGGEAMAVVGDDEGQAVEEDEDEEAAARSLVAFTTPDPDSEYWRGGAVEVVAHEETTLGGVRLQVRPSVTLVCGFFVVVCGRRGRWSMKPRG